MSDNERCGYGACVRPKGHTGSHSVALEGTPFSVPQDEDHVPDYLATYGGTGRSPQDEDHEVPCPRCDGKGREGGNTMPASRVCSLCHGTGKQVVRSPQDEDHEADINRILWNRLRTVLSNAQIMSIAAEIADRVSPSRVGSVAVEDVVHNAFIEGYCAAMRNSEDEYLGDEAHRQIAEAAWPEFSRSSTDDQGETA
jgi:RecJ-like exonuclease